MLSAAFEQSRIAAFSSPSPSAPLRVSRACWRGESSSVWDKTALMPPLAMALLERRGLPLLRTATCRPAWQAASAALSPARPVPTTTTSQRSITTGLDLILQPDKAVVLLDLHLAHQPRLIGHIGKGA